VLSLEKLRSCCITYKNLRRMYAYRLLKAFKGSFTFGNARPLTS